jgi:hypothetical protein
VQRARDTQQKPLVAKHRGLEQAGFRRHSSDLENISHEDLPCSATTQFTQELSSLDPRRGGYGPA